MNLIQIQDDLRQLPNTPQTLQLLAQYANGMNPTVPPYVALGELQSRNKRMQQLAQQQQAGQQPQGTVSEQVQQQAMAAQQPQQPPQQMQGMPQQPPQAGIAGLPVQDSAANFGSGGIVAFAKGSENAVDDDESDDDEATTGEYLKPSREILAKLEAQAENLRRQKAPSPGESPEVARARLAAKNPALFGSLVKPIGGDVESRLAELQKAQTAEYAKQREEAQKAKPSLFQQLGEAAIGSRGQYGRSALASILGGYSSIANKQEQQALEQEQGLRMKELGLQQAKMEVLNKLDEARRAHAEGRFDDEQKYHVEAAKIANTHNTTVAKLLGSALTAAGSLAGKESSANIAAKARVKAAETTANKPERQTDFERRLAIRTAFYERQGLSRQEAETKAERDIAYGTPAGAGVTARTADQAGDAFTKFALLNRNAKAYIAKYGGEENARKAYIADYMKDALPPELQPVLNTTPAAPKPTTAPAAAPAASGKVATRADIAATAARTGKSEAEVIEAAKAKGYTIQ